MKCYKTEQDKDKVIDSVDLRGITALQIRECRASTVDGKFGFTIIKDKKTNWCFQCNTLPGRTYWIDKLRERCDPNGAQRINQPEGTWGNLPTSTVTAPKKGKSDKNLIKQGKKMKEEIQKLASTLMPKVKKLKATKIKTTEDAKKIGILVKRAQPHLHAIPDSLKQTKPKLIPENSKKEAKSPRVRMERIIRNVLTEIIALLGDIQKWVKSKDLKRGTVESTLGA
eukprot:CAMPEP_0168521210 /NCGR_PEP_ID=MMETSP0405-20121227/8516_1 /TAXON_ID=498012 /ORGANISM="Trichosphaerium sp, Strain Am-I-7 wt" /LENGTH=225 /DNA_ID=CAMNT_0008542377 /DNA_START=62 /DNA_END=735 /DNA_ORIENTATION=-